MISTPLQRLYFRSVLCPYEENAGPSTRPGSQKSNAEFVLLHHDVISGIRRLLYWHDQPGIKTYVINSVWQEK